MSNQKNAQELLKWGLRHTPQADASGSSTSVAQISADIAAGKRPDLSDPNLYDALMGKSEAQMMREELSVAVDPTRPLDDRCTALDNFEMLIETIDNANNITSMHMWPPLLALLNEREPRLQTAAAWIVGTAVQNNDKAQVAILEFSPLAPLLDLLHSSDTDTRSKAMYALSGLLKHNPAAVQQFQELDGWSRLRTALLDPNMTLRRKTAFLLNTLLFQDPTVLPGSPANEAPAEPAPAAPATTTTTVPPRSTATALAPSTHPHPSAPLDLGPATHRTPHPHPNVVSALLSSHLLHTLLTSLLPASLTPHLTLDLPPSAGPDGDLDPRTDADYAEKAVRAVLTFVAKVPAGPAASKAVGIDADVVALLQALRRDLEGEPLDAEAGVRTRAEEVAVEPDEVGRFGEKVESWVV